MGANKPLKKARKQTLKLLKKNIPPIYHLLTGLEDFTEDFIDLVFKRKPKAKQLQEVDFYGQSTMVRPAYIFSVKIEYAVKFVIGLSLAVSAVLASFWGAIRLSDLFFLLVDTIPGRLVLLVIGIAYIILGIYKVLGLRR